MADQREIVKAGDTLGIDTVGADSRQPVVILYQYTGKKMPNNFKFATEMHMTNWVIVDGVVREQVEGYVYPRNYKPKGLFAKIPEVKVFSYLEMPAPVAAGLEIRVLGSDRDEIGSTLVKGTVRLDVKFAHVDPKIVNNLLSNDAYADTETNSDVSARYLSAAGLNTMICEGIQDSVRGAISANPVIFTKLDDIEAEIVSRLNADPFMTSRGLTFTKASLRMEPTAMEAIADKKVRIDMSIARDNLDLRAAQSKKKLDEEYKDL